MIKRFLIRHVGNMGDMIFFVPPVLAVLKRKYPTCEITLVTAWGYKDGRGRWGKRGQDGHCIALMLANPHVDQLVHYHDTVLALDGSVCQEEERRLPTWSQQYYEEQAQNGGYDGVYALDFGIGYADNPIERMFTAVGLPDEDYSHYQLAFSARDRQRAAQVMEHLPRPRIVLLEGLEGTTTRGWDPDKIPQLAAEIKRRYDVDPIWFGSKWQRELWGKTLSLRENFATLIYCDVGIGVLSGPLHFAAAVGLPTITLFADQPLHRAAPAYFLNRYVTDPVRRHRTLLGPTQLPYHLLKNDAPSSSLTPGEKAAQGSRDWQHPGKQATKTGLAVLTVAEVCTVLEQVLPR